MQMLFDNNLKWQADTAMQVALDYINLTMHNIWYMGQHFGKK